MNSHDIELGDLTLKLIDESSSENDYKANHDCIKMCVWLINQIEKKMGASFFVKEFLTIIITNVVCGDNEIQSLAMHKNDQAPFLGVIKSCGILLGTGCNDVDETKTAEEIKDELFHIVAGIEKLASDIGILSKNESAKTFEDGIEVGKGMIPKHADSSAFPSVNTRTAKNDNFTDKIKNIFTEKLFPSNNFEFIAENISLIYLTIKEKYQNKYHLSDEQALFAAGAIDMAAYIEGGELNSVKVDEALTLAHKGHLHVDCTEMPIDGSVFVQNVPLLNAFIMQIECLIFHCDVELSATAIMDSVVQNKKRIDKSIKKSIRKPYSCKQYTATKKFVSIIFETQNFPTVKESIFSYWNIDTPNRKKQAVPENDQKERVVLNNDDMAKLITQIFEYVDLSENDVIDRLAVLTVVLSVYATSSGQRQRLLKNKYTRCDTAIFTAFITRSVYVYRVESHEKVLAFSNQYIDRVMRVLSFCLDFSVLEIIEFIDNRTDIYDSIFMSGGEDVDEKTGRVIDELINILVMDCAEERYTPYYQNSPIRLLNFMEKFDYKAEVSDYYSDVMGTLGKEVIKAIDS